MAERPSCRASLSDWGFWGQNQGAEASGCGRGRPQCTPTCYYTHIKGQHLHRCVEELVLRVLNVPTAEEEPVARQACELLQGWGTAQAHYPAEKGQAWARSAVGGP